jgi:hypothetical protein
MQLMDALTAGKKFTVMGGKQLTSNDIFIAAEMSLREKEKQCPEGLKKKCKSAAEIEEKRKAVIETKRLDCKAWLVHELNAVLAWIQKLSLIGRQAKKDK